MRRVAASWWLAVWAAANRPMSSTHSSAQAASIGNHYSCQVLLGSFGGSTSLTSLLGKGIRETTLWDRWSAWKCCAVVEGAALLCTVCFPQSVGSEALAALDRPGRPFCFLRTAHAVH
jgi:hypothetical protein